LEYQRRLTWPSTNDCERLNSIIFETDINPFGIASYNPNEPVTDFVGRREELLKFKEQIQIVINNKISRSVKLNGPAGVGKSTLFNFLKESIEKERISTRPESEYILKDCDVLSTFFQIPDKISDFLDIWKPMLEGLRPGFEKEIGYDISLPEYITFQIVYRMFLNDREKLAQIIWKDADHPQRLHQVELIDIIDPLFSQGTKAVLALQEYYSLNKRELRDIFKERIKGRSYEIKRGDNKNILNLFRVIDEDDPKDYLELILDANSDLFKTNDDLINYFNDLMRYYACSTKKQPILLIGIDEAVKADPQIYNEYYQKLGNLFVKLRNTLNDILFVFISTTEDWAEFNNIIKKNTDLQSQLGEFMYEMPLTQLSVDELAQVFKNRMNRFWENYPSQRPPETPYYPFSENLFVYAYRYNLRDLRDTIHFLKDMWIKFKYLRKVPKFETIFESLREVRKFDTRGFNPNTFKRFEWNIIKNSFNNPTRFRSNSARSSAVEKGLEYAWKCLLYENPPTITRVDNNCTIITSNGTRRPDIYLEILGNLGAEFRRNIEFQVKAYDQGGTVSLEHIKSSLELFREQFSDFIYFIITGRGLKPDAEAGIKGLEIAYPNRIRRPILTEDQKDRLYLLALYKEITGKNLDGTVPDDLQTAKDLLSFITGQPIEDFLSEVKRLAYRRPITEAEIISRPVVEPSETSQTDLSSYSGNSDMVDLSEEQFETQIKWVNDYPLLKPYRFEASALCGYLKTREEGRYKFKFTIPTVEKNVIIPNASLDKQLFRSLVKVIKEKGYIVPDKSSFKLTQLGEQFYQAVKADNYSC
jgi:hypothetical protein